MKSKELRIAYHLKRILKKKVTITLSLMVSYLITGEISFISNVFNLVYARDLRSRVKKEHSIKADNNAGKNRPDIFQSINGTDVVDIVDGGNNGISHNKYTDFSVGENKNVILNNYIGDKPLQSQTGGILEQNANLVSGNVNMIINEVTGQNATSLMGGVEVFGKTADVVVANENGIYVNGGHFINSNGVTLTTGNVKVDGKNVNFNITNSNNGEVFIDEKGVALFGEKKGTLNKEAPYFNIISRTMEIVGPIETPNQELNLIAGKNEVKLANNKVDILNSDKTGTSEKEHAIKASFLGSMYGTDIKLIATEKGVGISHEGLISATKGIDINSNGDISLSLVKSNKDLKIKGSGNLTTVYSNEANIIKHPTNSRLDQTLKSQLSSKGNIEIDMENNIDLNTVVSAEGDIKITGNNMKVGGRDGGIKTNDNIDISLSGKLTTEAQKILKNAGFEITEVHIKIDPETGKKTYLNEKGKDITANVEESEILKDTIKSKNIVISANEIENNTGIAITNEIDIKSKENLYNSGKIKGNIIEINADRLNNNKENILENSGNINATKEININTKNGLNNEATISGNSNNAIVIIKNEKGEIINSRDGVITSEDKIIIDSKGNIVNSNKIIADKEVEILSSENILNTDTGKITGAEKVNIKNDKDIINAGEISSDKKVDINSRKNVQNKGYISSKEDILVKSEKFENTEDGKINALNDITLNDDKGFLNKGVINSNNTINIITNLDAILEKEGEIGSLGTLKIDSQQNIINNSNLQNYGTIELIAKENIDNNNKIITNSNLEITGKNVANNHSAVIWANKDITISAKEVLKNGYKALIEAVENMKLEGKEKIINDAGSIKSGQNLIIETKQLDNNSKTETSIKYTGEIQTISGTTKRKQEGNPLFSRWTTITLNIPKYIIETNIERAEIRAGNNLELNLDTKGTTNNTNGIITSQNNMVIKGDLNNITAGETIPIEKILKSITIEATYVRDGGQPDGVLSGLHGNTLYHFLTRGDHNKDDTDLWDALRNTNDQFTNVLMSALYGSQWKNNGNKHGDKNWNSNLRFYPKKGAQIISGGSFNYSEGKLFNGTSDWKGEVSEAGKGKVENIDLSINDISKPNTVVKDVEGALKVEIIPPGGIFIEAAPSPEGSSIQPLYETDNKFINLDNYYGSDYFFKSIGYNPNMTKNVIGDSYYEHQMINNMIQNQLNRPTEVSSQEIKEMLDSTAEIYNLLGKELGLEIGKSLTNEQLKKIKEYTIEDSEGNKINPYKDIDFIWYTEIEVNGKKVLAPQVYTGDSGIKEMKDTSSNNGIKAEGKLDIDADKVINYNGNIVSNDDITIKSSSDIINDSDIGLNTGIMGKGDVTLEAEENITMKGGYVAAGNNVELTATKGDINIESTIGLGEFITLESGETIHLNKESIRDSGGITSGGNVTLTSNKDINIKSSNIVAGDEVSLSSENVNITDRQLKGSDYNNNSLKGGYSESSSSYSLSSGSTIYGNNIKIDSKNDLTIKGSHILADEEINLSAGKNVNILDGHNEESTNSSSKQYNGVSYSSSKKSTESSTSKGSNIISDGKLNIKAGNDVNITGSDLIGKEGNIEAENNIMIKPGENTYKESSESTSWGFFANAEAGIEGHKASAYASNTEGSGEDLLNNHGQSMRDGLPTMDGIAAGQAGFQYSKVKKDIDKTEYTNSSLNFGEGGLNIKAKETVDIGGADLISDGDINVKANRIDTTKYENKIVENVDSTSFSLAVETGVNSSLVDSVNQGIQIADKAKETDINGALLATQIGGMALNTLNNDLLSAYGKAGITMEKKKSSSTSKSENITNIQSKGNINLETTGDSINLNGVNIKAEKDITLDSAKDVNIKAAKSSEESTEKTTKFDASISASADTGGVTNFDPSIGVNYSVNVSHEEIRQSSTTYTDSTIASGGKLTIKSKGDTNLNGAQATGEDVELKIDGNLNITASQNESSYEKSSGNGGFTGSSGALLTGVSAGGGKHWENKTETEKNSGITAKNEINADIKGNVTLEAGSLGSESKKGEIEIGGDLIVNERIDKNESGGAIIGASIGGGNGSGNLGINVDVNDIKDIQTKNNSVISLNKENVKVGGNNDLEKTKDDLENTKEIIKDKHLGGGQATITVSLDTSKKDSGPEKPTLPELEPSKRNPQESTPNIKDTLDNKKPTLPEAPKPKDKPEKPTLDTVPKAPKKPTLDTVPKAPKKPTLDTVPEAPKKPILDTVPEAPKKPKLPEKPESEIVTNKKVTIEKNIKESEARSVVNETALKQRVKDQLDTQQKAKDQKISSLEKEISDLKKNTLVKNKDKKIADLNEKLKAAKKQEVSVTVGGEKIKNIKDMNGWIVNNEGKVISKEGGPSNRLNTEGRDNKKLTKDQEANAKVVYEPLSRQENKIITETTTITEYQEQPKKSKQKEDKETSKDSKDDPIYKEKLAQYEKDMAEYSRKTDEKAKIEAQNQEKSDKYQKDEADYKANKAKIEAQNQEKSDKYQKDEADYEAEKANVDAKNKEAERQYKENLSMFEEDKLADEVRYDEKMKDYNEDMKKYNQVEEENKVIEENNREEIKKINKENEENQKRYQKENEQINIRNEEKMSKFNEDEAKFEAYEAKKAKEKADRILGIFKKRN